MSAPNPTPDEFDRKLRAQADALHEIGVRAHVVGDLVAVPPEDDDLYTPQQAYRAYCIGMRAVGQTPDDWGDWGDLVLELNGHEPDFLEWFNRGAVR